MIQRKLPRAIKCMTYYTSYLLTEASRNYLLELYRPRYKRVVCEHITEDFGVADDYPLPKEPQSLLVIGHVDSGDGVEALLVSINGNVSRPDGKPYHITHSLAEGREPVESNDYISLAFIGPVVAIKAIPKLTAYGEDHPYANWWSRILHMVTDSF